MPVQICESILSLPQFCVAYPTLLMPSSQMPPLHASLCAPTKACADSVATVQWQPQLGALYLAHISINGVIKLDQQHHYVQKPN